MINWTEIYLDLMRDTKGDRLRYHLLLVAGFVLGGLLLGMYVGHNINIILLVWLMGGIANYLLFGDEIIYLLNRTPPYWLEGTIDERIKRVTYNEKKGVEEVQYYFIIASSQANVLQKDGLASENYHSKMDIERVEVPESMFLSLEVGQEVSLVCTSEDFAWAWVKENEEVICIEE